MKEKIKDHLLLIIIVGLLLINIIGAFSGVTISIIKNIYEYATMTDEEKEEKKILEGNDIYYEKIKILSIYIWKK